MNNPKSEQNDQEIHNKVAEFLREKETATEETSTARTVELKDVKPSEVGISKQTTADREATSQSQEIPPEPLMDPKYTNTQESIQAYMYEQNVELTEEEKQTFLNGLLFDKPVVFDIPVKARGHKFVVKVSDRNVFTNNVIQNALKSYQKQEVIFDIISFINYAQQFIAATGVVAIDDQPLEPLRFEKPFPRLEQATEQLHLAATELLGGMNQIRWVAVIKAVRIFETKIAIASTLLNREDF